MIARSQQMVRRVLSLLPRSKVTQAKEPERERERHMTLTVMERIGARMLPSS